jgi:hypothetical protein
LRNVAELAARPIEGIPQEERPTYPVLSPDGESLVYLSDRDLTLRRIAVAGGTPVTLTDALADDPQGLSWDESGAIFYEAGDGNIMRLSSSGGTAEIVVAAAQGEELDGPRLLPGNEWLLFTVTKVLGSGRWDEGQIVRPVAHER